MIRLLSAAAAVLLAVPVRADATPAGTWKLTVPLAPGEQVMFLVALAEKDGAWSGEVLDSAPVLKVLPKVTGLKVDGDRVRFALDLDGRVMLTFDGVVAKDGKKLGGSYTPAGGQLRVIELYPSKLKKLDDEFELARETVAQVDAGQPLFEAAFTVLGRAAAKNLPTEEGRAIVERVTVAAAGYGRRWERETAVKVADTLAAQAGFADLAVAQARRAEKLLTDLDDTGARLHVLDALVRALTAAGKPGEAKPYLAEVARVEAADYAGYLKAHPPFKPVPSPGRKGKSDRAVLVEVFSGAECPPCAAVDFAFVGLMKTYPPAEAVLLTYHCHIPAPDPLTSPAAEARLKYYDDQVRGAPTVFLAGKPALSGGGAAGLAEQKYKVLRGEIDELLEKPARVKLALAVAKGDKGFTAKATVSGLDAPGEKVRLRFALAEERVRFAGGAGVLYHHMVVRAMPGGANGFPLTKKEHEETVAIDPDEVRETIAKYLDGVPKTEGPFPRPDRPLALANLKLIAFIQNDATRDVLHAVQVDLDRN
ncbi:MAG: hypothetical protein JWO38_1702 [Gemmataceae bacterium]|nr:hypothetical protein [Gemmataceae bacterium]